MKYSEFMMRIERQGLKLEDLGDYIEIRNNNEDILFCVGKTSVYVVDVDYDVFREQDSYYKKVLFNLAVELASTPLEEREDEKRYRLKLPFVKDSSKYLTVHKTTGDLIISHLTPYYKDFQNEFTEAEIAELKRKYNLDSFVLEEVKE